LASVDPANAQSYAANAADYVDELEQLAQELEALVSQLPVEKRKLVTDHDSLGYSRPDCG